MRLPFISKPLEYLPKWPTLSLGPLLFSMVCLFIIATVFDMPDSFVYIGAGVSCGLLVCTHLWERYTQLKVFRTYKGFGLIKAWEARHVFTAEELSKEEFNARCEAVLTQESWRNDFLKMVSDGKWYAAIDHFAQPPEMRWKMEWSIPKDWGFSEHLTCLTVLRAVLPAGAHWELQMNQSKGLISVTGGTYTMPPGKIPTQLEDSPIQSLELWRRIQHHLFILFDRQRVLYNKPQFVRGIARELPLQLPVSFDLANGGVLQVRPKALPANGVEVVVRSDVEQSGGRSQEYDSIEDFWWVWRHAIERVRAEP